MSIALPTTTRRGISGLLGRKRRTEETPTGKTKAKKQLQPQDIAKLFKQDGRLGDMKIKPAKLNAKEKRDRERLNSLRGALYSED